VSPATENPIGFFPFRRVQTRDRFPFRRPWWAGDRMNEQSWATFGDTADLLVALLGQLTRRDDVLVRNILEAIDRDQQEVLSAMTRERIKLQLPYYSADARSSKPQYSGRPAISDPVHDQNDAQHVKQSVNPTEEATGILSYDRRLEFLDGMDIVSVEEPEDNQLVTGAYVPPPDDQRALDDALDDLEPPDNQLVTGAV
jgi:hypothetical protein